MFHSVSSPGRANSILLAALLLALPSMLSAAVVRVPIHIETPLLEKLLVDQLFTGPGPSASIIDDGGCNRALLTEPRLAVEADTLKLEARVQAQLGLSMGDGCQQAAAREGGVGVLGVPVVAADGRSVRFEPTRTWLTDAGGAPLDSGPLWQVVDGSLRAYFRGFRLDLSPQFRSLEQLLPDFLPRRTAGQLKGVIDTLHLGELRVTATGLEAEMRFEVDDLSPPARPEGPLTQAELEAWESRWQMMDSLLVLVVKHYAAATRQPELQSALLDVLIDSRYRLRDALVSPPSRENDSVRAWFLDSWQRLAPLARAIAAEQPGQEWLQLLSLVTAADALQALDRMGPGVGLEISTDGIRRLARLINAGEGEELLRYTEGVDPELVELFRRQLEAAPAAPPAARTGFSLFPRAWAQSPAERLNNWAPRRDDLPEYLPLVAQLLERHAERNLSGHRLEGDQQGLFRKLVLATAWQESCWRQYVVSNDKLVPLRSGTGDVGLMQVNEKVWRGFYDVQKLRWDIDYNAGAGAQILLDYLVRYAIPQREHDRPGGESNLARASYSAYNGGPRQVARYRRSDVPGAQRKVDAAFWEKYRQVDAGRANQVAACLGGEPGTVALRAENPPRVTSQPPPRADSGDRPGAIIAEVGRSWVHAQPRGHYTLQLGAFSTPENASRLIRDHAIPAPVYIYPRRRESQTQYLVVHGSFSGTDDAEAEKRRFGDLKPWSRRFADLVE